MSYSYLITAVPDAFWWILSFVFGCMIGSFLNVCIWRMPREESVVSPPSRCTACKQPIAWHDNIPVISWLLLRGKCRHCSARIAWRYPFVEALSGAATLLTLGRFGFAPHGLVYLALVYALIVVTFIDIDFQIIPDEISVGGTVAGLLLSIAWPALHGVDTWMEGWRAASAGVLVGGGTLYLTGMLGDFLFKKESMGGGDIKLLAMAGAFLGWKTVLITFFISPMLAVIPGLLLILFKKEHVIPYGPFLALGLLVALFADDWVLRVSGFDETIRLLREYHQWQ